MVAQKQGVEQVVEESCSSIVELVVPAELPTVEKIFQLAAGVRRTHEKAVKVQFELNLQIAELQLQAQSSINLEVIE